MLPLQRFQRFRAADVDEARELVAREFNPHQLCPLSTAGVREARFHSVRLGDIGLNYLDYGASVRIAPADMETFHLVQIPLSGKAEIVSGVDRIVSDVTLASVPSPTRRLVMRWDAGNPQIIVWLDREALQRQLTRLLGRPLERPLHFELGMDLGTPAARAFRSVVDMLVRELDDGLPPTALAEVAQLLMTRLLLAQPGSHTEALARPQGGVPPKLIRQAAELIEAHADEPLTVADVAEAVGVGVRALQEGFRRHLDTTPMAYLREIRLRRAAAELAAADPARVTVTDVAARWGFLQLGRFSVRYKELIGESPSTTLRS